MSNTNESKALIEFRRVCQEHGVFYGFLCDGVQSFRGFLEKLMKDHSVSRCGLYRVGEGHPLQGLYPASLSIGEVLDKTKSDGEFQNMIAKLTIVAIYAKWEEVYRKKIATDYGKRKCDVNADLMGDIRKIRHRIIHHDSNISNEETKLNILKWNLSCGALSITREMMMILLNQINEMEFNISC